MKQFRKRMLSAGLAVTVVLGTTAPSVKVFANQQTISTTTVTDVADNHWAKKQIDAFIKEGVIQGYPDKTFKPSNKITRAEFVRIVNRAFGFTDKGTQSFKDVKADAWYTTDIQIAVKKGYINGFEDNTFRPNEEITREQMAKILGMVLNVSGDGKTNFLDDAKIASWAKKYVDGLAEKGIIEGYTDKTFKPKDNATRAESVRLIADSRDSKDDSNGGYYPIYPDTTPDKEVTLDSGATTEQVQDAFENYEVVNVENAKLDKGIDVPKNKTLVLSGKSSIAGETKLEGTLQVAQGSEVTLEEKATMNVSGTVDLSQGTMKLDGTLSLENGGTLNANSTTSKAFTKDIKLDEAKITGTGAVLVGNGTIQVDYLGKVQAKIENVTSNSKLSVGDKDNWLLNKDLGEKAALTLNSGTLSFEFGAVTEETGKTHYVIVNGKLTFNNAYRSIVVKSGSKDSELILDNKRNNINELAHLYNGKENPPIKGLDKTSYTGNADGTWTKVVKEQIVNVKLDLTTSSTVTTTPETIGSIQVTTGSTTTSETTTAKLLVNGTEVKDKFDLNTTNDAKITVELGNNKTLKQLVLNDKVIKLPETLDNGAIITVTLTKEELATLVGENGTEFNITVVTN